MAVKTFFFKRVLKEMPTSRACLLSLPTSILSRIYIFVLGFKRVEIEIDEDGLLLASSCRLLRICRQLRHNILAACEQKCLQLVYTVRSPAAMISLILSNTALPIQTMRCVLLAKLEGLELTERETTGWDRDGHNIAPLFRAWRVAFRSITQAHGVELVYFDLVRSFDLNVETPGRLINSLSATLSRRSGDQARCRIIGCRSTHGQKFFENCAVNVIESGVDLKGRKLDVTRESLR